MKIKILFPDALHFHKRNFKSLMEYIENKDIETIFSNEFDELKALYGNYKSKKSLLIKYYDILSGLSLEELYNKQYKGINVFEVSKAELLSFLMPKSNWLTVSVSSDTYEIFKKSYKENKEELLLNMSMSIFWIDYWSRKLSFKNYKNINACVIFSGSLIYVKTLSYLLQNTKIKVFVVEHFFTGNDYYFEEKYTHIANNGDIKFNNIYSQMMKDFLDQDSHIIERDIIKAINKIKLKNNKNVKQPKELSCQEIEFDNTKKVILIIGQVINDFSILETLMPNINSLEVYKNIIDGILTGTDYNIIFKAHPWELQKVNIKESLTKNSLLNYVESNYGDTVKTRFKLVENYNIETLFNQSDIIVGLSSQSLLEAAFMGYKTHQIGQAFFGNKNFTFDHKDEFEFLSYIKKHENIKRTLSLQEYRQLMNFFAICLEHYLVSSHNSGKAKLHARLSNNTNSISIIGKNTEFSLDFSVPMKRESQERENPNILDIFHNNKPFKKKIVENIVLAMSSDKKAKKFLSNPKQFFEDSNYLIVKLLGKIY